MAKRAYGREDKQERRAAILAAAMALFRQGRGDLPSAADIAAAAGLAKGTVYLYFRTKETIFSVLLLQGWGAVVGLVEEAFSTPGRDAVDRFLGAYVDHLDRHRELLRLDALRGSLERNLEMDGLIDFKRAFRDHLTAGAASIDRALDLAPGRGVQLLMRTHALTCGLWQSLGSEDGADTAPEWAPVHPDFITELSQALTEYWRGALAAQSG